MAKTKMIGTCFYYDTPPKGEHLFVVVAPCLEKRGWFVCVNITTKKDNSEYTDTTCELYQGEHEELTSPISIVVYAETRSLPPPLIERKASEQNLPRFEGALLLKIQRSPLTGASRLKIGFKKSIESYLEQGLAAGV